jgi:hypothetical protein
VFLTTLAGFCRLEYVGVDSDERMLVEVRRRWSGQPRMQWVCVKILLQTISEWGL